MPLGIDEATKRYERYSQNIQDAIFTMESHMGNLIFTFDLPQAVANINRMDTTKEEREVSAYIEALEEYKKIIILEKKRRALHEIIEGKMKVNDLKANLKRNIRAQRLAVTPYQRPQQSIKDQQIPPS